MAPYNPIAFAFICIGITLTFFEISNGMILTIVGIFIQFILDLKYIDKENKDE